MAGGILQLTIHGSQDTFLIGNPQITYFKIVYRRHTNFAMEPIRQDFTGTTQQALNTDTLYKCKISRVADLMNDIYFVFTIPDIYSESIPLNEFDSTSTIEDENKSYEFQWIKNLGNSVIDYVSITIGGSLIDIHYGEWLTIWSELTLSNNKKDNYYKLIGNIPELYDPAKANNGSQQLRFNNIPLDGPFSWVSPPGFVPTGPTKQLYNNDTQEYKYINTQNNWFYLPKSFPQGLGDPRAPNELPWWYKTPRDKTLYPGANLSDSNSNISSVPSILGRKIYVPLHFWFCKNTGLALPLIALQYHEIEIQINLKKIYDWYTIITRVKNIPNVRNPPWQSDLKNYIDEITGDNTNKYPLWRIRTRPSGFLSDKNIDIYQFLKNSLSVNNSDLLWEMDPHLLINFIYLDDKERKKFALMNHEYLIEQVQTQNFSGLYSNESLLLLFQHPVKELIWTFSRDDKQQTNQWNNYTNWRNIEVSPWNLSWYNDEFGNYINGYNYQYPTINPNNIQHYKKNIMEESNLIFNGEERFSNQDFIYFNYLQPYKYHNGTSNNIDGIYNYSFSFDPENHQPSGTCNFSRINKVHLRTKLLTPPDSDFIGSTNMKFDYLYNCNIYAINYNVLKIMGGIGALSFSN